MTVRLWLIQLPDADPVGYRPLDGVGFARPANRSSTSPGKSRYRTVRVCVTRLKRTAQPPKSCVYIWRSWLGCSDPAPRTKPDDPYTGWLLWEWSTKAIPALRSPAGLKVFSDWFIGREDCYRK